MHVIPLIDLYVYVDSILFLKDTCVPSYPLTTTNTTTVAAILSFHTQLHNTKQTKQKNITKIDLMYRYTKQNHNIHETV